MIRFVALSVVSFVCVGVVPLCNCLKASLDRERLAGFISSPTALRSAAGLAVPSREQRRPLLNAEAAETAPASCPSASKKKKDKDQPKEKENPYTTSITLPQTRFSQRANAVKKEPQILKYWENRQVYQKQKESNEGSLFILHDGPPYANGPLHMGHALNKILKDIVNRYKLMQGRKISFVPGWDCHGLPIELQVLKTMSSSEKKTMTPVDLRRKAKEYAEGQIKNQKAGFKRFGVMADWDRPYVTMQREYEAAQIGVFGRMALKGCVCRGRKPVHWSPSSRTALAEAELEYPEGHKSRSVYVALDARSLSPALEEAVGGLERGRVRFGVWTTTPWTLPANRAVAVNPRIEYAVVRVKGGQARGGLKEGDRLVIAKDLLRTVAAKLGPKDGESGPSLSLEIETTVPGETLCGSSYVHPLFPDQTYNVVPGGEYITTESGTGLVHTAPGHGQEDFVTGKKFGLPAFSPVDDAGRFTEEVGERFAGKSVLSDGNEECVQALTEAGALLLEEAYSHKYPYDWRTKKPTIFRATDQWFASVDAFRDRAFEAIDSIQWVPAVGKVRISSMVSGRSDWCISRQRTWGLPIPVFFRKSTGEAVMTAETIGHVQKVFREEGSDVWWSAPIEKLLPPSMREEAEDLERGRDTMDVWFDSGSSWAGVLDERGDELRGAPADMYLEGSDQHRGWFQSSVLTRVAASEETQSESESERSKSGSVPLPCSTVVTHGFVLDERGTKMSKSVGNVVDPLEVIEGSDKAAGGGGAVETGKKKGKGKGGKGKGGGGALGFPGYGADVLRLWVASVDFSGDVLIGKALIQQVFENYRRIRNTCRFLTGNLFDFDPSKDAVAYEELPNVDRWALGMLSETVRSVERSFEELNFKAGMAEVTRLLSSVLSSFYLDTAKDRLYVQSRGDPRRRACQTVLFAYAQAVVRLLAPVLPFLAEEMFQNLPSESGAGSLEKGEGGRLSDCMDVFWDEGTESVFERGGKLPSHSEFPSHMSDEFELMLSLRRDANLVVQRARDAGKVGSNSDAEVVVFAEDEKTLAVLSKFLPPSDVLEGSEMGLSQGDVLQRADDVRSFLLVSSLILADSASEVKSACPDFNMSPSDFESQSKEHSSSSAESSQLRWTLGVRRAGGKKCDRCWLFSEKCAEDLEAPSQGQGEKEEGESAGSASVLCPRCASIMSSQRKAFAKEGEGRVPVGST
uniref:isoleucine--tRNA ligase n=1 Tax=Chromera velia CCMP2878 TaxID=1169474 RepID=A0A0G4HKH4_9ALVE|eukprot:Cvel_28423.t1-p1 / transcript=Cvel_28423.t1 / gene=Cvel_28423 / organism=Chromera_velia_CCMP2878 / gene_product=Isoleucine--tRNA ligase, putative / transcript_product=Isoleucine--tRNA ligase, putative / location=Cvel_scaffold3718:4942-9404(-) / protein_length=1196 / sequence_SO=supercontig / SO=protein_coding / is_pseudo=false